MSTTMGRFAIRQRSLPPFSSSCRSAERSRSGARHANDLKAPDSRPFAARSPLYQGNIGAIGDGDRGQWGSLALCRAGSGQPIVFVHGALSDLRVWEPVRAEIAKRNEIATAYRFVAYTQRYFGTGAWPDDGRQFGAATHADDLAEASSWRSMRGRLISSGLPTAASWPRSPRSKIPALVRSLVLYEPALVCVLPEDSEDGKAAREDRAQFIGPVISALRAGDATKAARLMYRGGQPAPAGRLRPRAASDADEGVRQCANHAAAVRRAAIIGHHGRAAEGGLPVRRSSWAGKNTGLLRADQRSDQQVLPGRSAGRTQERQPWRAAA